MMSAINKTKIIIQRMNTALFSLILRPSLSKKDSFTSKDVDKVASEPEVFFTTTKAFYVV